jgi:hypothetical protein
MLHNELQVTQLHPCYFVTTVLVASVVPVAVVVIAVFVTDHRGHAGVRNFI